MTKERVSDERLREAVALSTSYAEAIRRIGRRASGSTWAHYKRRIDRAGFDTSHFTATTTLPSLRQLAPGQLLVLGSPEDRRRPRNQLARALLAVGFKEQCALCSIVEWLGQPIVLHIDHINGRPWDNRQENLRFLCPNCHSQTETFGFQAASDTRCECGHVMSKSARSCRRCWGRKRTERKESRMSKRRVQERRPRNKIEWPDPTWLSNQVQATSYSAVGRRLGVSDNAVRKRIKQQVQG